MFADVLADGRTLLAVADGMGGHAAGEVASALAVRTLQDALAEGGELGDAFRQANERVHGMAREPGKQGMGTTLTAVLVDGPEFRVANVPGFEELLAAARDDARMLLAADPDLTGPRGNAIRTLLYLFECDEAVKLFRAA